MPKALTGTKKTAWDAFAQWVRVRDCIEATGYPFVGVCITCGKNFHISALHAGHMMAGRQNAKLFDEQLVHVQCYFCNFAPGGKSKKFRKKMVEKHGEEQVSQWERKARKVLKTKDMDFPAITQKYREKIKSLLQPFGYKTYSEMLQGHQ